MQTIIDHIGVAVTDVERSEAFYARALAPLGIFVLSEGGGWIGMGRDKKPEFWFGVQGGTPSPVHVAFTATSRAQVRAFYAAALAAGGRDNGPPGIREVYHPTYYGAFVLDLDGHNIEAVCHKAE
jgi:catechol 2,3-dioxygenase-like lactoylglutathione lyase family enzyme